MDKKMDSINIPTEKIVEVFLHAKQFEQHYATQESVDNLKESVRELKSDTNKRFDAVEKRIDDLKSDTNKRFDAVEKRIDDFKSDTNKRFDSIEHKFDRFQWFLVASVLAILFQDKLASLFM
ncbi:hypothetical protein [Vibrio sp. 10N.261.46.A3]|uniref:hypothetical protein n=1 Tax=Vibrio sp. 10N.261.46.A3 TaxID=3229658 RepID=UPI00354B12FF